MEEAVVRDRQITPLSFQAGLTTLGFKTTDEARASVGGISFPTALTALSWLHTLPLCCSISQQFCRFWMYCSIGWNVF